MKLEPGRRTALSQLGGPIELWGEARGSEALRAAFEVEATETAALPDVHGFHSYPARMHPDTAGRLIAALSAPGQIVLDPFCGSGTVLVEARRQGRRGVGYDINPLSRELGWLKTLAPSDAWLTELTAAAATVAAHADERRKRKAGATQRYDDDDRAAFAPHVLLELDGLRDGIRKLPQREQARALFLVLSALLTKVSQHAGDSAAHVTEKRVAPGFPSRFFVKKTDELAKKLAEYRASLPAEAPLASFTLGDARKLPGLGPSSVSLVVSSPPYPGVYDYLSHHDDRLRWLGLSAQAFEELEIGSRRELSQESFGPALARWERDLKATLTALKRGLTKEGRAVLLIADSTLAGKPLFAERVVEKAAPSAGLELLARASQARPHFHGGSREAFTARPRREHLLLLGAQRAG
ncbi:MAG TPA: DNA methyltransferase [Polyangiaceae bacterium]|nr:DNA methyltransferase [Polyangiaceae bacterium]